MHSYSVESRKTHKITFVIGLVTVGAYIGLGGIIQKLAVPSWIELPSVFVIFYAVFQLWNHVLWKAPGIRDMTTTEYIGGKWVGEGKSSYEEDGSPVEFEVTLDITQTWSSIEILFQAESSHSVSTSAYLVEKSKILKELVYTYQNNPNYDSEDTMKIHEGTCKLRFDGDKDELEGEYYTDPNRGNSGSFTVEKEVQDSLITKIKNKLKIR